MHWMNPLGAWGLLAVAAILFLHILKQRTEPVEVSSTYLWQKALAAMEADRPFQKLRRSPLLFLQVALAALLALSLLRPMTLGGEAGEVVFVFDLSASMQADDGSGSRLAKAVADARRRVDGLPEGARVSVLTAGTRVAHVLSRASDKGAAKRALDALEAENGGADLEGALSLAFALRRELADVTVVVYTDQALRGVEAERPSVGPGLDNRALLSLNAGQGAAVARVANYGGPADVTVECYADGALCDVRSLALDEGEVRSVQFDLPGEPETVRARIADRDALAVDNERLWAARDGGGTTVVLAGRDNLFLEKALDLRPDIRVLKTTPEEAAAVAGGSLTVLDGPLPQRLPESGALLLVDPDVGLGEARDVPTTLAPAAGALAEAVNQRLEVEAIQLARWKPVLSGTPIWTAQGEPVLTAYEEGGRRVAVLGFDLHDANLPLLKEFPLVISRLLEYLAPEPLGVDVADATCGDVIPIRPRAATRAAAVVTPSGRRVPLDVAGAEFGDTGETGLYSLLQTDEAGVESALSFALHAPSAESDVREAGAPGEAWGGAGQGGAYGREWTVWAIGLALLATLGEWWVYRRGY